MNILVTGANGQLGSEMRLVSKTAKEDSYIFTDVVEIDGCETTILDITDIEALRKIVAEKNVKCIVNCAAYTNVDKAESDEDFCRLLNAKAPENLAKVMNEVDGLLVHVSTDYVFGGDPYNVPCKEDQKGTPTGVYGQTKLEGEQAIQAAGCKYIILRTAWLYSEYGRNFVKTMLNLTATKPQLKVVFDQTGTPTYAYDLAVAIFDIVENRKFEGNTGIYHYSNEGVCSWFDFTKMIQAIACELGYYDLLPSRETGECPVGLCDVQPCHSNEFPSPVTRPAYSVLDKTKVKQTFGIAVPYWTDSLRKCIANLKDKK